MVPVWFTGNICIATKIMMHVSAEGCMNLLAQEVPHNVTMVLIAWMITWMVAWMITWMARTRILTSSELSKCESALAAACAFGAGMYDGHQQANPGAVPNRK